MAKKKQDLKPDVVLKNYWEDNEQFADLFNAVLFKGKPLIKPEELEDMDSDESSILEHKEYVKTFKIARDNIKLRKKSVAYGVQLSILGLESQEHIHYAMPMRVMGYDYAAYRKQYERNAGKYQTSKDLEEEEYLSKMKKTDKFIPAITIVIYYGEKPWDAATTLHGMLDIPDEIAEYVNDYKMILIEARQNGLTLYNNNNVDLFNLLEILLDKSRPTAEVRNKAIEYSREHQVNKTVAMTVAGIVNMQFDYNALNREKGGNGMITVFEETKKEGRAEGIIETGIDCGLSENDILERLQNKLNVSLQMAQEYFKLFGKKTV